MKDQRNRDFMAELYRLIEKYETPKAVTGLQEFDQVMQPLLDDISRTATKYTGNEFAIRLLGGLYESVADRVEKISHGLKGKE